MLCCWPQLRFEWVLASSEARLDPLRLRNIELGRAPKS